MSRLRQESGEVFRIKDILSSRKNKMETKDIVAVEKDEAVSEKKRRNVPSRSGS